MAIYRYGIVDGERIDTFASNLPFTPHDVEIDGDGTVYVTGFSVNQTSSQRSVLRFDADGTPLSSFTAPTSADPAGLVIDSAGDLWVNFYNSSQLVRFDHDGVPTVMPGGITANRANNGLAIDACGSLFTVANDNRGGAVNRLDGLAARLPLEASFDSTTGETGGGPVGEGEGEGEG
ncbi:MAG TPA: hypothetical protein VGF99_00700, partial [Myxococcota bacterium]